jgi:dolichyl-diphosphooligosaccharide---protein glycosyltransferase
MTEATAIPVRVSSTVLASNGASGSDRSKAMTIIVQIVSALYAVAFLQVLYMACKAAYEIRMYAINEYGRVIHEFDPYFNYRAAEYLWQHGTYKFFRWFDYQSWYPLGRPVGTTIYPGMQFTSVWIKQFLLPAWSINDICCLLPAWFGVLATLCTASFCFVAVQSTKGESKTSVFQDIPLVAQIYRAVVLPVVGAFASLLKKTTGSNWGIPFGTKRNPPALESAVFTACLMSIVPAHLMRSVGGGYDNESVATTAMQLTFCMWSLTLWAPEAYSLALGALTGVAYFYMVTCWGGYIFVINLIGVHALCLLVLQKFSTWTHLYKSYTSFYIVGTFLAMRLPVVGWAPLKSLEQLGPFGVWAGMQILHLMYVLERKYVNVNRWKIRSYVVFGCLVATLPVAYYMWTSGYVGPLSSRVRGLFVKHTKTGNPLVDSVAEHQAASPQAYREYLNIASMLAPYGYGIVALFACTPSSSFLLLYGVAAYFFSHKMVRLILLTAPIASICGGIALGYTWAWIAGLLFGDERPSLGMLFDDVQGKVTLTVDAIEATEIEGLHGASDHARAKNKAKGKKKNDNTGKTSNEGDSINDNTIKDKAFSRGDPILIRAFRLIVSVLIIKELIPRAKDFHATAHRMAKGMSHPTIIAKGRNERSGEEVLMDDYREAYWWLRDNTPEDSRIMAWWDYGYQITGISNRTTIADG